jgi:hypothetical protein
VLPVSATRGSRVASGGTEGILGGPGQELNKLSSYLFFGSLAVDKGSPLS